jgi:hypothetical protein
MKNMKLLILSLFLTTFFFSCKNSKEDITTTKGSSNTYFTAKINGSLVNFCELNHLAYARKTSALGVSILNLTGIFKKKNVKFFQSIEIKISNYKGIGKYKMGIKNPTANVLEIIPRSPKSYLEIIPRSPKSYKEGEVEIDRWFNKEGEVEITEETKDRIIGTFSFTTKKSTRKGEEKNITDGKFNIPIIIQLDTKKPPNS